MKKSTSVALAVLMILLSFLPLFSGCQSEESATDFSKIRYYNEIPGVTMEDVDAVEKMKLNFKSFTYVMNHTTECFYNSDGVIEGYSALFCEWMSRIFGVPFTPVIREWDELVSGIESHGYDFSGEITYTEERAKKYFMTDTIAERMVRSFRLGTSLSPEEIAKERPVKFAFLEGTSTEGLVTSSVTMAHEIVHVPDYETVVAYLRDGTIDVFFDDGPAEAAFSPYLDVKAYDVFPIIYSPVSLTTANPDLKPVIDIVQKFLDAGGLRYLIDMYNEGETGFMRHRLISNLTDDERGYIDSMTGGGKSVKIGYEYDNYPISFYNTEEKEWQGIAVDIIAQVSQLTGLNFEVANTTTTEWYEILDILESGQVSLVSELLYSADRDGRFLWTDEAYLYDTYALLSLAEMPDIKINQLSYYTVGLVLEAAYTETFNEWFPTHENTIVYNSTLSAFDALERGEIDLLMCTQNLLLSFTNYMEKPGFKANLLLNYENGSSFGFNLNEPLLCSIVNKAQKLIDTHGISSSWTRKVFDYRAKVAREQVPIFIAAAAVSTFALVLILVFFLRNRSLNKNLEAIVQQRTGELEVQTRAAQVASRAKSDFLARMSHEIRTPLNAIMGMAHISQRSLDDSEKMLNSTNEIIKASNHLLGILNDILDMSKIESGKFSLSNEPFSLVESTETVRNIISQRCSEKEITFDFDAGKVPDVWVTGDKLRTNQVLINLLGNAVKFTEPGGTVGLSVDETGRTEYAITLNIRVTDNGIGMTKEQISRLFQPFEQTDASIAARFGGTGLGLAISQNLVAKMGGHIVAESAPGEGSTFSFRLTFPLAANIGESGTPGSAGSADLDKLSGKTILLAEDIEINRFIVSEMLSDTGIIIECAANGEEAVKKFVQSPAGYYSLIFMDIQMPVMDGYQATRKIRSIEKADAQTIPIVAMTANAYREDVENVIAAGMNAHIAKPIDLASVHDVLLRFI